MNTKQLALTASLVVLTGASTLALAEGYSSSPSDTGSPAATQDNRSPAASRDNSSPMANQNDSRSAGTRMDDATITTQVKAKLMADERVKATDIDVDTASGIVTLSGNVKTEAAKNAAEELARQVEGVASVDNRITAGPATAQQKGQPKRAERVASDSWITTKVKSTLLADHVTKGLNIGVKTMNGTVSLSGNVGSQQEFDRAVQVAKGIKGVKKVNTSQLQIQATQ